MIVKDGAAENGDTVVIDFVGSVDGVEFDGGKGENHSLELGSGQFIPGFEDQLVGAKAGDEVEVKVTFPEDYQATDLAGKAAVFATKVNEVKAKEVPALDDELAKCKAASSTDCNEPFFTSMAFTGISASLSS